jgi:hypothetical protein
VSVDLAMSRAAQGARSSADLTNVPPGDEAGAPPGLKQDSLENCDMKALSMHRFSSVGMTSSGIKEMLSSQISRWGLDTTEFSNSTLSSWARAPNVIAATRQIIVSAFFTTRLLRNSNALLLAPNLPIFRVVLRLTTPQKRDFPEKVHDRGKNDNTSIF